MFTILCAIIYSFLFPMFYNIFCFLCATLITTFICSYDAIISFSGMSNDFDMSPNPARLRPLSNLIWCFEARRTLRQRFCNNWEWFVYNQVNVDIAKGNTAYFASKFITFIIEYLFERKYSWTCILLALSVRCYIDIIYRRLYINDHVMMIIIKRQKPCGSWRQSI